MPMKKLLLICTLVLSFANLGYAQGLFSKICLDKYSVEDSVRVIQSCERIMCMKSYTIFYSLKCVKKDSEVWRLELKVTGKHAMKISKGRKFLLKFQDGSIMELENIREIGAADYDYHTSNYGTTYSVYPSYPLSEDELKKIIDGGVVKVRLENNVETIDMELVKARTKQVSRELNQLYTEIKKVAQVEKKITDDF